ncbi:hypothetical protein [Micromonospora aurantiaca (nom. illeg.)]|uniref:hypothetical protein n=1 Tax=Micromonospora aurantiaca (nom. illeg.) TaxID=47850 RepID=UPI003404E536
MPHRAAEHAVVFVPASITDPADFAAVAAPCLERVDACGYAFIGIVRSWDDALEMTRTGRAEVVVVASLQHLPPTRTPRVEAAGDPVRAAGTVRHVVPPEVAAPQRHRRPRRVR